MKITLAVLCLVACSSSALAQYGVSNARDGNGNLIRNSGMNPGRNWDRAPVNNLNGPIRQTITPAPNPTLAPNTAATKRTRN
ncbi:hypothetical protein [Bradyrhizobium valentinum]|uniref:hypothetical protein n=1 Tax=Bradyrhizobium valentinum TaxID=1518501 RepID=UPI000B041D3E|nr:hypothetical protein [Bradyrhizobium valentinum]